MSPVRNRTRRYSGSGSGVTAPIPLMRSTKLNARDFLVVELNSVPTLRGRAHSFASCLRNWVVRLAGTLAARTLSVWVNFERSRSRMPRFTGGSTAGCASAALRGEAGDMVAGNAIEWTVEKSRRRLESIQRQHTVCGSSTNSEKRETTRKKGCSLFSLFSPSHSLFRVDYCSGPSTPTALSCEYEHLPRFLVDASCVRVCVWDIANCFATSNGEREKCNGQLLDRRR